MRTAAAATALGITLSIAALSSCATPDPGETHGPSPSVTPVFASEEEALAAAEALYAEYVAYANALGQSGWADPSGFEEFVVGEALTDELEGAGTFHEKGWVQVGETTFDTVSLQQLDDEGAGEVRLTVYLCSDVTGVDVLGPDGASVVSSSRPHRQALEVDMDDSERTLKIVRSEAWAGADFC